MLDTVHSTHYLAKRVSIPILNKFDTHSGTRTVLQYNLPIGQPLLDYDLRGDDTPIEANLEHLCRKNGPFKGSDIVNEQRKNGVHKRLAYLTIDEDIPLWGLEGVYRNGESVGFVRRGDYGFTIGKSIGKAYIKRNDGGCIDDGFLKDGHYELNIKGAKYPATLHMRSPFDEDDHRIHGFYS